MVVYILQQNNKNSTSKFHIYSKCYFSFLVKFTSISEWNFFLHQIIFSVQMECICTKCSILLYMFLLLLLLLNVQMY